MLLCVHGLIPRRREPVPTLTSLIGMEKNKSRRSIKLAYLQHTVTMVAVENDDGEIGMKPSNKCKAGDVVWILEGDNTFTRTEIY